MSYISSLNLLGNDSPISLSEEALSEELALWANAQFTFDTEPGSAISDDAYKAAAEQQALFSTFASSLTNNNNNHTTNDHHLMSTLLNSQPYLLPASSQQQQNTTTTTSLPLIAPAPTAHTQQSPVSRISNAIQTNKLPQLQQPKKRKLSNVHKTVAEDTEVPESIEEDKRKRNTAASARFRMKKKQREQALEQTTKEMALKTEALEKRVIELEKEAKWLRALVVEKDPSLLNL